MNHGKPYFFKYVTMEGLQNITSNLSRKWSCPLAFNDPFDAQFDLGFPFTFEAFAPAFLDEQEKMVFDDQEPSCDPSHPLFRLMMLTRQTRHQRSREEFRQFFRSVEVQAIPNLKKAQEIASQTWTDYIERLRILCLTETHDDLLMWAHYANHHTGAVVRLGCVRERDSVLLAAIPVKYSDRAPYIGTLEEWIRHLTGQKQLDYDGLFQKLVTTKSTHWAYEKEWRVINLRQSEEDGLHMYNSFLPEEIEAVYFGCRATNPDIENIVQKMHPDLSHVEFLKARKKKWEYGLEFERIETGYATRVSTHTVSNGAAAI